MKGDHSARAAQHLEAFFSSPPTFNLTSFSGTELSHNFLELTENSYTVLEKDKSPLPPLSISLHIQTS